MEREPKSSLGKTIRINLSGCLRRAVRSITEIPFALRVFVAPEGELVRGDEVVAAGRVVRYSGDVHVIFTANGSMVFPNTPSGDSIRLKR